MKTNNKYLTPREVLVIVNIICKEFLVTLEDLESKKRESDITEARAIICYIVHGLHNYSPTALGRMFNKTHSNVNLTSKRVLGEMETDSRYKEKIERLIKLTEF